MCTECDHNSTDEIEITPEMIDAGADVLRELDGEASREFQAAAIFQEMLAVRPARSARQKRECPATKA